MRPGGAGFEQEEVREVALVAARENREGVRQVAASVPARPPEARAAGVEHASASDRLDGRGPPQDEAVTGPRGQGRFQRDLGEARRGGRERVAGGSAPFGARAEALNAPRDVRGPEVHAQARAVHDGAPRGRQPGDLDRQDGGGLESAAGRRAPDPGAGPAARPRRGSGSSVSPAQASLRSSPCTSMRRTRTSRCSGKSVSVSSTAKRPPSSVPVTTGPKPFIVNARSRNSRGTRFVRSLRTRPRAAAREGGLQRVDPGARDGGDRHEGGVREERAPDESADLVLHESAGVLVREVALRARDRLPP